MAAGNANIPIPKNIVKEVRTWPKGDEGVTSPYPTVVKVAIPNHIELRIEPKYSGLMSLSIKWIKVEKISKTENTIICDPKSARRWLYTVLKSVLVGSNILWLL